MLSQRGGRWVVRGCAWLLAFAGLWQGHLASGQVATKKPGTSSTIRKPPANTKLLDTQAQKLHDEFVRDATSLADQYVSAGELEKARTMLQAIVAVSPGAQAIRAKLKQVEDQVLAANDVQIDVSAKSGWQDTNIVLQDGKTVRFTAVGSYRLELSNALGAEGFPDKDPSRDVISSLPAGALIGIVIKGNKPGKPFLIGEGRDYTPRESGPLYVRINSPLDNKNTGKISLVISGNTQTK